MAKSTASWIKQPSCMYSEVEPTAKEYKRALKNIKEEEQLLQLFRDLCNKRNGATGVGSYEQSKAAIDTAITRKAEEFQDQVARRHAELLPIATDCNEALEEIQRLEKAAETLDASCNSNTKFLSTRHKQLQELKGALDS